MLWNGARQWGRRGPRVRHFRLPGMPEPTFALQEEYPEHRAVEALVVPTLLTCPHRSRGLMIQSTKYDSVSCIVRHFCGWPSLADYHTPVGIVRNRAMPAHPHSEQVSA